MALTHIEHGSLASSEVMNNNFEYLDNRITTLANNTSSDSSSIYSSIENLSTTLSQKDSELETDIDNLETALGEVNDDLEELFGSPDYLSGISISTFPYTVQCDGYVDITAVNCPGWAYLYVNDVQVAGSYYANANAYCYMSGQYKVKEGDIVSTNATVQFAKFFPLRQGGENNVL